MQIELNEDRLKELSWSMKKHLAVKGFDVPNTTMLEALAQGLGFSNYRTFKQIEEATEQALPTIEGMFAARDILKASMREAALPENAGTPGGKSLAAQYLKGETEVFVYLVTSYVSGKVRNSRPRYARMTLNEETLAAMLDILAQMESAELSTLTLTKRFDIVWLDEAGNATPFTELKLEGNVFSSSVYLAHEDAYVETEVCKFSQVLGGLLARKAGESLYQAGSDGELQATSRYLVADSWGHIFYGTKESHVSFVFDRQVQRITHMTLDTTIGDNRAGRAEIADVEDSLLNANYEALEQPEEWGLEPVSELPTWALEQDRSSKAAEHAIVTAVAANGNSGVTRAQRLEPLEALAILAQVLKDVMDSAQKGSVASTLSLNQTVHARAHLALAQYDPESLEVVRPSGRAEIDKALEILALAVKDVVNAADNEQPYTYELAGSDFADVRDVLTQFDAGAYRDSLAADEGHLPSTEILEPGLALYEYHSPFSDYRRLKGQRFRITQAITKADAMHDAESLPMYVAEFESGEVIEVFPEEIVKLPRD